MDVKVSCYFNAQILNHQNFYHLLWTSSYSCETFFSLGNILPCVSWVSWHTFCRSHVRISHMFRNKDESVCAAWPRHGGVCTDNFLTPQRKKWEQCTPIRMRPLPQKPLGRFWQNVYGT